MPPRNALALVFFLAFPMAERAHAQADVWRRPLTISVFTLGTQLPGGSLSPLHPGLTAGTEFRYSRSDKNQWLQTAKLGIYYHKYSQMGIQLYSEAAYRRALWQRLTAEARLGAGYLHAVPDLQVFELRNGEYRRKKTPGRAQFMAGLAAGLGYRLGNASDAPRVFVDYQFFLQMPFVKSYVPLLPNTALHLGIGFPFFKTKNN